MYKSIRISLGVLLWCCVSWPNGLLAQYQDRPFSKIDKTTGLSHNSVYKIFKDRQGYVWFGTLNGLNRYDGYRMTSYHKLPFQSNSLPDNWITQLAEDTLGHLWIGTHNGGLSRLHKASHQFLNLSSIDTLPASLHNKVVWGLLLDSQHKLWVGHGAGFDRIDPKTLQTADFEGYESLKTAVGTASVNVFLETATHLYLGTWGSGLVVWAKGEKTAQRIYPKTDEAAKEARKVKDVLRYNDTLLYLATSGLGLYEMNLRTGRFRQPKHPVLRNSFVQTIARDTTGALWLGTQADGLFYYHPSTEQTVQFVHQPEIDFGLPSDWIPDVYTDPSGLLWVATDLGVMTTSVLGTGFRNFPLGILDKALSNVEVRCLLQHDSTLWLGTVEKGLVEFDLRTERLVEQHGPIINPQLKSKRIWDMTTDYKGRIWLATGTGLYAYSPAKRKLEAFFADSVLSPWVPISNVSALMADGTDLWVGTWNGGFSIYNLETKAYRSYRQDGTGQGLSSNFISKFYKDRKGFVWIGTVGGGLQRFDPRTAQFRTYRYHEDDPTSLSNDVVTDILEDEQQRLWVATSGGGLCLFDAAKEQFRSFTTAQGVAHNAVFRLFVAKGNALWASTESGLSRIDTKSLRVDSYTRINGILKEEFSRGCLATADNRFWLSAQGGILQLSPHRLRTIEYHPPIVITQFKRFNNQEELSALIDERGVLNLAYDDYVLSFSFSALDFRAPEKNKYAYILEGLDNNWVQLDNQNTITFPALPDGEYTLHVQATNSEGKWSKRQLSLPIRVRPPFYKTLWFYVLAGLILAGLVYLIIWLRTRRLRNLQDLLQHQVAERTKELEVEKQKVENYSHEVEKQRDYVTQQRDLISSQNKELTDSIVYARRIQTGVLPEIDFLGHYFADSFLYFAPRDIVSGDFFWYKRRGNQFFLTVADCTGHGVPGAFMSLLGISQLNEIVKTNTELNPAQILDQLREKMTATLSKDNNQNQLRDGINLAFIKVDLQTRVLEFAGAYNSIYIVRANNSLDGQADRVCAATNQALSLAEWRGDRMPIGRFEYGQQGFSNRSIQLQSGDRVYLFTDGYPDQLDHKLQRKYTIKAFKQLLLQVQGQSLGQQHQSLIDEHQRWRGNTKQVDDMLVVGFEV